MTWANQFLDLNVQVGSGLFTPGRGTNTVGLLALHDTCGPQDRNDITPQEATTLIHSTVSWFLENPAPVSIHWLVGPEILGAPIYHFCHESDTAYHVGGNPSAGAPSHWIDPDSGIAHSGYSLNEVAIGIERFGNASETIGPNQLSAMEWILTTYQGGMLSRWPILKDSLRVVDHRRLEPFDRTDGARYVNAIRQMVMGY